jgi:hypothetical protein
LAVEGFFFFFFFFFFFLLGFGVFLFWFKLLRGHSSLKEWGTETVLNVLCVDFTEQYSRSSLQLCHCWLHLLGWGVHMMIASTIHLAVQIFVRRPSDGLWMLYNHISFWLSILKRLSWNLLNSMKLWTYQSIVNSMGTQQPSVFLWSRIKCVALCKEEICQVQIM